MHDLLPELYSLMLKNRFDPKKDKRNVLVDSRKIQEMNSFLGVKENETIGVFYDALGFLSRELPTGTVTEVDEGAYAALRGCRELKGVEGRRFTKVLVMVHPGLDKKQLWKFLEFAEKKAYYLLPQELYLEVTAEPVFLDYSPLAVMFQGLSRRKRELPVKQDSFHPRPPARKVLVEFELSKNQLKGKESAFQAFLERVFKYKNKDLEKALSLAFKERRKGELAGKVERLGLAGKKVFQTEVIEFAGLFNALQLGL
ncbi:MAG TPA: rRNA adenine N-6-methyltransferase family protein [archaeon]|nr:rRNA adenine N-6-methyltransferase family protein [archaeon]